MIPFRVEFRPGEPIHESVTYAARRAILAAQLRPGDPFPSVRALSKALKINPNTAHKVIAQLTNDGLLEVKPGIGTVVAEIPAASRAERARLLGPELERLVVEAKRVGLEIAEIQGALTEHWRALDGTAPRKPEE